MTGTIHRKNKKSRIFRGKFYKNRRGSGEQKEKEPGNGWSDGTDTMF
jgi:hypothetical protein